MAIIETVLTHIDDRMSENDHLYGHLGIRNDELQRLKDFLGSFSVPGKPSVTVEAGDGKGDYTITAPEDDGGSPITGYVYRLKKTSDASWGSQVDAGADLTGTVSGLENGTEYSIEFAATNEFGQSAWDDSLAVHFTPTAPAG
ncbi:fibronectin type III domain-containing protein, partial [Sporolactobacillus shoreicorticis]|uniref:Fibronectin type III domain-containing protein n=1 Tax=Sporolactobacillus shoreicorticis TaxID=1923877 RepID=A0ABW5S1F9_9BACL